jgi:eukaryotic-like serine/threonine-protein kinase
LSFPNDSAPASSRIGTRVGPYEITAKLGEGGMGEVYRATDSRLDRQVAIKVLPPSFVADPERLARFEREAKLLAQLHHPNIASIFGLEESEGTRALVMELVEGEDLAARLARGPLALDEVLAIARQIAEALEAAHEKGIVHRDLKPQNVKLAPDGTVKVLDFGLAKAMDPAGSAASAADLARSPTMMQSPTLTAVHGTQLGVILGTAAYMAPEQARGGAVDKRADIWAFGVVLYEMLAGRSLFAGETVSDTLAGVLKTDIDFTHLPAGTPSALRSLLRRCLERNPKNRLHDIADARIALDELLAGDRETAPAIPATPAPAAGWKRALPWLVASLALLAAAVGWIWPRLSTSSAPAGSVELAMTAPADAVFFFGSNAGWGVVSPDGRQVVFPAIVAGQRGLWIRPLDGAAARRLPGTEVGIYPFWSPDSRNLAFYTPEALMKIDVAGGSPERICASKWGRGGSWGASGWIVFNREGGGALARVHSAGGEPVALTEVDAASGEDAHYWPVWLPGDRSFLYFIRSGRRENQGVYRGEVVEGGIDRGRRRIVASSSSGLFAPAVPGRGSMLLWADEDRLLARAFDPGRGQLDGAIAEVARGVRVLESQLGTMASVSDNGTLVFASSAVGKWRVESFDRQGQALGALPIPGGDLHHLEVSPDGARVAWVRVQGGQGDIWVHELTSGATRALTTSAAYDENPAWSTDSKEILFESGGSPAHYLGMSARADGAVAPRQRANVAGVSAAFAWLSEDWALAESSADETVAAIRLSEGKVEPVTPALKITSFDSRYSPAAQALAYVNDEGGAAQGFVVSVRQGPSGIQLGSDGQRLPVEGARSLRWRQDGRELFAIGGDAALWAVPVERRDDTLHLGAAEKLFADSFVLDDFDVYDNGRRFLFRVDPAAAHQTLGVVLNWPARLDRVSE